jgi:hypothetical protein
MVQPVAIIYREVISADTKINVMGFLDFFNIKISPAKLNFY